MAPVPQTASYWAYLIEFAGYIKDWLVANNNPQNDGGLATVYYDGELGAYYISDFVGPSGNYETFINECYKAYVNYYVQPAGGSVSGFRNFTGGQLEDVLRGTIRNASGEAYNSIVSILTNGSYVAIGDCTDPALSRECAYAIKAHINAQRAGVSLSGAQLARLAQLKIWSEGHCDAWINNTAPYFRPFMGALTANALIEHYTYIGADPATITRLADLADYAWASCWKSTAGAWGQANSFLYTDRTGFNPEDAFVAPDLNNLISPWWGWLYYVGAGVTYRTNGDLIFQGGIPVYSGASHIGGAYIGPRNSDQFPSGKQYFQQLYWGPKYIQWAEAGTGAGTAYTSSTAGSWTTSTNWTPNGVPGIGDTVTIASGANITVNSSLTVGTYPVAGIPVITVDSGATLTIGANNVLTCAGDVNVNGTGQLVSAAGSGFIFDASLAAAPSTTHYKVVLADAHNNNTRWIINGTTGSRCFINSNISGGNGYISDGGFLQAGLVQASYCDFNRVGTTTVPAITASPTGTTSFILDHCTFNGCGRLDKTFGVGADGTYQILYTTFENSIDSTDLTAVIASGAPIGTGTRQIYYNSFDKGVNFYSGEDFSIDRNAFFFGLGTTSGDWASFTNNFVLFTAASGGPLNAAGDTDSCYFYFDDPTSYNPHFIQPLSYDRDQTHHNNIFDMNCASVAPAMEGDCYTFATPAGTPCTATITNNIALVGPNNKTVGTMFTMLGNINTNVVAYHNTCFAGTQGAAICEGYSGHASQVVFKSNLVWSITTGGYKLYAVSAPGVVDVAPAADITHNGGNNLSPGSNLNGYNGLTFSAGTPGANDVTADPLFVDYARNLRTWSAFKGGDGTDTDAYARIKADPYNTLLDLFDYIQDGFTTQQIAYENAGHDGVTIGAVGYLIVNPTMSVSPVTMVANTTGNVITVTGVSTSWVPGTPGSPTFTISGVTGAAITAQVINTPTSATLTITASTGGSIGVAEISDGSITAPVITVTPPTPQPGTPGQNARRRAY